MMKQPHTYLKSTIIAFCAIIFAISAQAQNIRPVSGVVAASSGPVKISFTNDDGAVIGRQAGIGDPVYLNDEIATGPDMSLQILLKDQTVFSIGPNSVLVFDEFIYDPGQTNALSLSASITKGSFKFISGKISKLKPGAMKLKLPNATASVRGTSVAGRVGDDGASDIVLLTGAVQLSSASTPPVDILQSGWGVSVSAGGSVGEPEPYSAEQIDQLIESTAIANEDDDEGNEGAAATQSASAQPDADEIEEVEALLLATIAPDAEDVSASSLVAEILKSDVLLNRLADNDVAIEILQDSLDSNVTIDTDLITYLLSGGSPLWFYYGGSGGVINPPPNTQQYAADIALYNDTYDGLVATSYSGSVNFQKQGLVLAPSNVTNGDTGSGTANFNITLDYDTAAVTGSFSTSDIIINGTNYGSVDTANSAATIANNQQVNGVAGLMDGVNLLTGANLANNAFVEMTGHFGSITNGTQTEDGTLGGFEVNVFRAGESDMSLKGEVYQIGTTQP